MLVVGLLLNCPSTNPKIHGLLQLVLLCFLEVLLSLNRNLLVLTRCIIMADLQTSTAPPLAFSLLSFVPSLLLNRWLRRHHLTGHNIILNLAFGLPVHKPALYMRPPISIKVPYPLAHFPFGHIVMEVVVVRSAIRSLPHLD